MAKRYIRALTQSLERMLCDLESPQTISCYTVAKDKAGSSYWNWIGNGGPSLVYALAYGHADVIEFADDHFPTIFEVEKAEAVKL